MARDAISRQYDVDKNRVTLTCEGEKGSYRPGIITFYPKPGKTIDLRKMEESIRATRLSGGTSMKMDSLEVTATGTLEKSTDGLLFKVSGSSQTFLLKEPGPKDDAGATKAWHRLQETVGAGTRVTNVTGRVQGWSGIFPVVLRGLAKIPDGAPSGLVVSEFETSK
jgi:hypothetical protein